MPTFSMPVRIRMGDDSFAQVGREAAAFGRRALIIAGGSAKASGTLQRAVDLLGEAGLQAGVFTGVSGEPSLTVVNQALVSARLLGADVLIGIGGGSQMDVAKAVSGLMHASGAPPDYLGGRELDGPTVPWIAVPTTSGTGAEVTMNAVLTDEEACQKKSIRGEALYARVAIVDPVLTLGVPPKTTAYSGADALCQAIEPFVSIGAMPLTDALCREAIALIGGALLPAFQDGSDLAARRDMHYGSLMAGIALANARLGAVHGMAHPLGCRYHLAHGLVCGLLLPHVMEWNLPIAAARYAEVAALLGVDTAGMSTETAAAAGVGAVRELLAAVGIPERLSDAGVGEIDYEAVARESMSASMKHNPRAMDESDVVALLKEAT
ncbi:MAG: iron-containing alcohol dehydrogenase family protein [Anaerolineae bacterium]